MPGLALVGFMGAGKSTTGPLLASRLGWPFVDLDALIEEREGASVSDLFQRLGEAGFRKAERRALLAALEQPGPLVLSTGGGTLCAEENRASLRSWGETVYLEVPLEVLALRVGAGEGRPLWSEAELRYRARQPIYESCDRRVDGRLDVAVLVEQILEDMC